MKKNKIITHVNVRLTAECAEFCYEQATPKKYFIRRRHLTADLLRRLLAVAQSSEMFKCSPTDEGWEIWPKYMYIKDTFEVIQKRHYRK